MSVTQKTKPVNAGLAGRFFHSVEAGKIKWQGVVIGNPEPGWYVVQLFDYVMGEPNVQRIVRIEDMRQWLFYPNSETMQFSFERGVAREGGMYR